MTSAASTTGTFRFRAAITFHAKQRSVTAGFRPTLVIQKRKALCVIEQLAPESLPPGAPGEAIFVMDWSWPVRLATAVDAPFEMLEGERPVGSGRVLAWSG